MAASLTFAVAAEVLLLACPFLLPLPQPPRTWAVLVYASALFAAVPLLAGSAITRSRIAGRLLLLAVLLAIPGGTPAQQPAQWHDSSPHQKTLVTVDEGVQLEVLDWGGSGRAIVLLAGLGDTAHVYDDFAPMLAREYHVYGVTRRGHPHSSEPTTGYEFTRLAEDVVRVVKALSITKPVVVGHSIAGEEMHVLGSRYAAQVSGLVYVDAAFNRAGGSKEYETVAGKLPAAPAAEAKDLASVSAFRAFRMKIEGTSLPEAHVRARYLINANGRRHDSSGGACASPIPHQCRRQCR
jgi:hypothetical protein